MTLPHDDGDHVLLAGRIFDGAPRRASERYPVGGGNIYDGATGVITMEDRPTTARVVTTYNGHIDY